MDRDSERWSEEMYSGYWSSARGRQPDVRRFTVVEGDTPLPLGATYRRKRLRSAGEDDDVVRRTFSRPNPEGSLSAGELGRGCEPEGEELQRLCQRCHIVTSQLNRQAAALADSSGVKKLQPLQGTHPDRRASVDAHCDVCGASFHLLRRLALRRALGASREAPPPPPASHPASAGGCGHDELPPKLQRWSCEEQRGGGALWGWGRVQSAYLGGGGAKGLATVTPLPLKTQQDLEGLWRVSFCRAEPQRDATAPTSDGVYVTMKSPNLKPAAHSVATQTSQPPSGAAAFFIRAAQKLSLSRRKKSQPSPASTPTEASAPLLYSGGFSRALQLSPPTVPPCLLRAGSKVKDKLGVGKVRVMIRISSDSSDSTSLLKVDSRRKQLTLCESAVGGASPTTGTVHRRSSTSAPHTFTFDAIFSQDTTQAEVCSGAVTDVLQSVVNGADGCIFCFGHANLGKTYTMIGQDCSTQSLGVAPTAISWLFKVIAERREKIGARFSVRVSAVEISGQEETLTDLLADFSCSSPAGHQEAPITAVTLREDPLCGSQLQNQMELLAASAEEAAFFLDAALSARKSSPGQSSQEARRNSHFLFTLHLYQERADKSNKAALSGHSRLHLLDLGSCESDIGRTREGGGAQCLSLSALGNVVLALANGAKHVPYRDSKLTMLLSESLGNINCQTIMIAHVSDSVANFMETLTTVQLASRIHGTRAKRSKKTSSSSGGDSSCEEGRSHRPLHSRVVTLDPDAPLLPPSDPDFSSSSDHSCDSVIYVGPGGTDTSERELDHEGASSLIPIIPSLMKKRVKDTGRSDGDHFKCNTFAELQERLDCIGDSEDQATFRSEGKAAKPEKDLSSRSSESTTNPDPERSKLPSTLRLMDSSRRTRADCRNLSASPFQPFSGGMKSSATFTRDSEPLVLEKDQVMRSLPKMSASSSSHRAPRATSQRGEEVAWSPSAGKSRQTLRQSQPGATVPIEQISKEVSNLWEVLPGQSPEGDVLSTTVTLQQPIKLNAEDELVFTLIEELPLSLSPDNGRPSNLLSFQDHCALRSASGCQPVSIISSINDEYEAFTSQHGADVGADCRQQSAVGSGLSDVSSAPAESKETRSGSSLHFMDENVETQTWRQLGIETWLKDSSFLWEQDSVSRATLKKTSSPECPPSPDPTKAPALGTRDGTLKNLLPAQIRSNLPRKTQTTSSAATRWQDDSLLLGTSSIDRREAEFLCPSKPPRSTTSNVSSQRPGGNSTSVPRPTNAHVSSLALRVVDGFERSSSQRGESLFKLPRLNRGAMTLGSASVPQNSESKWSNEGDSATGSLKFSSQNIKISRFGNISPSTQSSQPPGASRTRPNTGKSSFTETTSEEELMTRIHADPFSHRRSSHHGPSWCVKTVGARAESSWYHGSLTSLGRGDSHPSAGIKSELSKENSRATLGGNHRSSRSVLKLRPPTSMSTIGSPSKDPLGACATSTNSPQQLKSSSRSRAAGIGGSKVPTLSTSSSKNLHFSSKPLHSVSGGIGSAATTGRSPVRICSAAKTGRSTIMATKQATCREAEGRVSEPPPTGSQRNQLREPEGTRNESSTSPALSSSLPSPYSKITAPRRPQRYSSVFSGELPPAGRQASSFHHSAGSSGYESMIRDSETTGSTSSPHDSMSDGAATSSNRNRASKTPRKRGNGFQRRRFVPATVPDASSLGRRVGDPRAEQPALGGSLKETFEIKVYEIDEVELLQRRTEALTGSEPFHDVEKGFLYFNVRLRLLERRQQRIAHLINRRQELKEELKEVKSHLMLCAGKWNGQFEVDQDLDQDSQGYLEALVQATAELETCVNLCKSRLMMETCFDIGVTAEARLWPQVQ